jgi:bacterial/archaeal transporter family protein
MAHLALLFAVFAALTAIFAKIGVENFNSDLATFIRATVVIVVLPGILAARDLFQPLASTRRAGGSAMVGRRKWGRHR